MMYDAKKETGFYQYQQEIKERALIKRKFGADEFIDLIKLTPRK